jgi:galactose oxidase
MNITPFKGSLIVAFVSILSFLISGVPSLYFFAQNALTSQITPELSAVSKNLESAPIEIATESKQQDFTGPLFYEGGSKLSNPKPVISQNLVTSNLGPSPSRQVAKTEVFVSPTLITPVKKLPVQTNTNPIPEPIKPDPVITQPSTPDPFPPVAILPLTKLQKEGRWSDPFRSSVVGIQASTLPNGKILLFDGSEGAGTGDAKNLLYEIYDTATKKIQQNTAKDSFGDIFKYSAFCAAMAILPNGNLFFAGGDVVGDAVGSKKSGLFDSISNSWSNFSQMSFARWYPSAIQTLTGEVLVVGGTQESYNTPAQTPEVYNLATNNWKTLSGAEDKNDPAYGGTGHFYPWLFNLSNNKVANLGPRPTISLIDTSNNGVLQKYGSRDIYDEDSIITSRLQNYGSVARFNADSVLVTGGGSDPDAHNDSLIEEDSHDTFGNKPTETANIINLNELSKNNTGESTFIRETARPQAPRTNSTLVIMADGNVMLTGGTSMNESAARNAHYDTAIQTPELWNKTTETWASLAQHKTKRIYHSIALLQNDATILQGGGSGFNGQCSAPRGNNTIAVKGTNACHELDIYEPGYLFDSAGNYNTRPQITSSKPANLVPGSTLTVTSDKTISKVTFVRPGNTTHSTNIQQYFMETSVKLDGSKATSTLPNSYFAAPKGIYMMFVWDQNGTPSIAQEISVL